MTVAGADLETVDLPLAELHEWPRNPRRISKPRLEQLKRALEAEPHMLRARPLIALPDGTVVAGNQRLRAARELGWESLPVVVVDLDEARAAEWALRDNQGYGEDDEAAVGALLAELAGAGRDLDLTGYGSADVDRLLAAVAPAPLTDPDDAPPVPAVPKSVRGEVYELGPHRLMCGDATSEADVAILLDGERPAMIYADPPYGMRLDPAYGSMHGSVGHRSFNREPVVGDERDFDAAPIIDAFTDAREQFWFGADYYRATLPPGGSWVVWDKRDADGVTTLDAVHGSGFELVWSRQSHKREIARVLWSGHHGLQREDTRSRIHPTQKPVALAAWFFDRRPEALILDPFAGSGSTLIACEQLGRRALCMEIDPAYCDVIRQRYADFTGQPQLAP